MEEGSGGELGKHAGPTRARRAKLGGQQATREAVGFSEQGKDTTEVALMGDYAGAGTQRAMVEAGNRGKRRWRHCKQPKRKVKGLHRAGRFAPRTCCAPSAAAGAEPDTPADGVGVPAVPGSGWGEGTASFPNSCN